MAPRPEQCDQENQMGRRLFEVEALREMRYRRGRNHRDREPPGAALATGEPAREPDHPEAERQHEGAGSARDARRQHALHKVDAARHLRRQDRDDRDTAGEGSEPGKKDGRRWATHTCKVAPGVRQRLPLPGGLEA